jgi:uncharacterized protein YwgA
VGKNREAAEQMLLRPWQETERNHLMNEIELEATIEALRTCASQLEKLRHIDTVEPVNQEQQKQYVDILDSAYTSLGLIETRIDELGQELEYHHDRLGKIVETDDENQ